MAFVRVPLGSLATFYELTSFTHCICLFAIVRLVCLCLPCYASLLFAAKGRELDTKCEGDNLGIALVSKPRGPNRTQDVWGAIWVLLW